MQSKFMNDKNFEEKVCQALLSDHSFAEQMLEDLNVEYFNLEHLKELTKMYFDYHGKYKSFPSMKLLFTMVKDLNNEILRSKLIEYFRLIIKEPLNGDAEFIKETVLDFCKRRSLAIALESSLDLIENKKYEQIIGTVQKALLAGSNRDVGHVYSDNLDKRMASVKRNPVPTPWPELNAIMGGGLSGGELGVIMASTGMGKSHSLVDIAHNVCCLGFNAALYTLELRDLYVGKRVDARVSGVNFDDLCDHKEEVAESLKKMKGHLVIKEFPAKSVTTLAIKNHVTQLTLRDKRPHIILVDSGDLMRSSRHFDQKRLEEESIFEELRALSMELDIPIWTVTQSNREGLEAEVLTLKHVAECFGKAMIADFFLTMTRQKDTGNTNSGNFYIAKSRLGPDGIKFNILVNTALSKFEIMSEDDIQPGTPLAEINAQDMLKRKLRELQKDGKLS